MIVVDTTVLVYAVGTEHALRAPCRALVEQVASGKVQATTTIEVIQEFAHLRARRRDRADAAARARSYAQLFAPLLMPDEADLFDGLAFFEGSHDIGPFDAVLAASALRRRATALVSADRGFATVPGLRHLDPTMPDFVEALVDLR